MYHFHVSVPFTWHLHIFLSSLCISVCYLSCAFPCVFSFHIHFHVLLPSTAHFHFLLTFTYISMFVLSHVYFRVCTVTCHFHVFVLFLYFSMFSYLSRNISACSYFSYVFPCVHTLHIYFHVCIFHICVCFFSCLFHVCVYFHVFEFSLLFHGFVSFTHTYHPYCHVHFHVFVSFTNPLSCLLPFNVDVLAQKVWSVKMLGFEKISLKTVGMGSSSFWLFSQHIHWQAV